MHLYSLCRRTAVRFVESLEELYARNRSETGLVVLPRLKLEHIQLTSFSKMRVDLAAQVRC